MEPALDHAKGALSGTQKPRCSWARTSRRGGDAPQGLRAAALPAGADVPFRHDGIKTTADDAAADKLLKRKSKTANLHGLEKLGIKPLESSVQGTALVFRGGRAQLPDLKGVKAVGVGVFTQTQAKGFEAVLPGASFAEKDGTVVNFQGKEQRLKRSILPPGSSKALPEILMMWANRKAGQ